MKRRLLTDEEKRWRRHQRNAERKNAADLAAAPLFPLETARTAESEFWKWRQNVAIHAGERCSTFQGDRLLDDIRAAYIRRYVASVLGPELTDKLLEKCGRTYPSSTYYYGFWRSVLTGKRVVFSYSAVEDRQPGQSAVIETGWYEHRHMSCEEFHAMFPYTDPPIMDHPGAVDPWNLQRSF